MVRHAVLVKRCVSAFLKERMVVQLVEEARRRWIEEENGVVDDITAVVVKFNQGFDHDTKRRSSVER